MTRPRRLASVDIGSNTIHALVGEVEHEHVEDIGHFVEMPELGPQVDRSGRIGPAADLAVAALEHVVGQAAGLGYERLLAGATAAIRRGDNQQEVPTKNSAKARKPSPVSREES